MSIPHLIPLDHDTSLDGGPFGVPPAESGPVEGTPEWEALRNVEAELRKIPVPGIAQQQLDDARQVEEALRSADQPSAGDPMRLLIEALPELLQLAVLVQECQALLASQHALAQKQHQDIHALQARVGHLESLLAWKPPGTASEDYPATSPSESEPSAEPGLEVVDDNSVP